jgi:hypothetical protein
MQPRARLETAYRRKPYVSGGLLRAGRRHRAIDATYGDKNVDRLERVSVRLRPRRRMPASPRCTHALASTIHTHVPTPLSLMGRPFTRCSTVAFSKLMEEEI